MFRFGYADTRHGQVHHAQAGDGFPLVLLPGSARSHTQFSALAPFLAPHFRLVAFDTLGYGASAPFPSGGTLETIAESIADAMEGLGVAKAHVFGMHTGHKVAAALARGWPGSVDRLVIAGKTHSLIPEQEARNHAILERIRSRTHLPGAGATTGAVTLEGWSRTFRSISGYWWNEDLVFAGGLAQAAALRAKVIDELRSVRDTGAVYQANFDFDFAGALRDVAARTLVLEVTHPTEDAAYGRQGARLAAVMPDAVAADLPSTDEVGLGCNADAGAMAACMLAFLKAA